MRRPRPVFQFPRPRGARPCPFINQGKPLGFQFTRPRGARLRRRTDSKRRNRFQFTRPRGARQTVPPAVPSTSVSIHAPARGATRPHRQPIANHEFQFTRPRGARREDQETPSPARRFNSRAREGRDRLACSCSRAGAVSIHAPARGATEPP